MKGFIKLATDGHEWTQIKTEEGQNQAEGEKGEIETFNIQHSTFNIQHSTFNIQRPMTKGQHFVNRMDNYGWTRIFQSHR
ncbi:MAG: hypothetical protein P4N60_04030 [Verrucomicrobiae bacterium]|nr:hypothetical protein [Verrucomicrobiae bacterium]